MTSINDRTLRERLEWLDKQISVLQEQKEAIIREEPPTFEHIALPYYVLNGRERYVIILGDGSLDQHCLNRFSARPAAFSQAFGGLDPAARGRYVLDLYPGGRKGRNFPDVAEVLDKDGAVVGRVQFTRPKEQFEDGVAEVTA